MERRVRPAKRKRSEGSYNGNKNAKKPLLQVTLSLTKVKVSQEQLKRLQKQKLSTKHLSTSTKDEEKKEKSATVNNEDASCSSSQITRESPVRHRLSNLLDGSVPSPYREHSVRPDYGDENVTNTNCEGDQFDTAKSLSNPDSVKACLFHLVGNSVDDDSSPPLQDRHCITLPCYPEVVTKTVLQVEESLTETGSASATLTADIGVASAQEHFSNEVMNQHHGEKHSNKNDAVLSVLEQAHEPRNTASNSSDVAVTDLPSGTCIFLPGSKENEDIVHGIVDGEAREKSEPLEDSGCGSMSSSKEDNSLDYASGYNTLEVMNSLLSDLTEERSRRVELEERISTMEERNKDLLTECEKLKELVNDLFHLSKVKAETVSRGTQINMDISLRRGRTIDRATSPLRRNDPSPDLEVLSFSIGCQTNPDEVKHPKTVMSTSSQTDEEVIPPKTLMSIASQTDLYMPLEVWPQARAAPQSAFPSRVQQTVMPNFQATAPVQLQSSTHSTQASSMFHAGYGQFYQMPLATQSQQTFAVQSTQQGQPSVQVNTLSGQLPSQILALLQHPTTTSRTLGLQSAGYQSAAFSSPLIRTSQPSVGTQYTPSPSAINQGSSMSSRQTDRHQLITNSDLNAYINAFNAMTQRSAVRGTPQTARQAPQISYRIAQGSGQAQHVGRQQYSVQQQANPTRTLQQIVDSRATLQSRISTAVEETNRANQIQHQRGTVENQSAGKTVQSSITAYQQGISPQMSFGRRIQPPVSQPERQVHSNFRIQGNTLVTSQNQQGANLNLSTNQSTVHGRTVQQSVAQCLAVHTLHAQGNPLMSQNYQSANLNASMNQSAISGVTVQQSITPPVIGNVQQLQKQRNPFALSQNQQGANLNLPINQTGIAVQQSTQSPPIPTLVQTQSSNKYNDTIRQLSQASMERNAAVSERQLRVQPSAQALSLYDEVRRVYSELQQSLDEITANKQKQRNLDATNSKSSTVTSVSVGVSMVTTTPPCDSNSELPTTRNTLSNLLCHSRSTSVRATPNVTLEGPSSNQAFNSDKTKLNRSSPSVSLQTTVGLVQQNGAREHASHVFSNKDSHRKPPKTPSGALENTVQRLLARSTTCVADLLDGTFKSTSVESLQSELVTSSGRSVSLPESQLRNESAHNCSRTLKPDTVEAVSLGQNGRTNKGGRDWKVNSLEGIFVSPMEIDVGERQTALQKTFSLEENIKETGDSLITEEVGKETATADGCTKESTDNDSDSVFIAPSIPVKRKDDSEKIKDDLYIDLMSPIIPPIATAKRVWPRIPQFNCDHVDVTYQSSENEDQGTDATVQNTGSVDKAVENDPNQAHIVNEIQGAVKYTDNADPERTQGTAKTQQDEGLVDSSDPENIENDPEFSQSGVGTKESLKYEGSVNKVKETVAEAKQGIGQTGGAMAKTDFADPSMSNGREAVVSVVGTEEAVEGGDNAHENMENVAETEQSRSDTHQAVTNVGNADPYVDSDLEFPLSVVEAKESAEDEDNIGEDMETDTEPKQQAVLEKEFVDRRHAGKDMGTSSETTQLVVTNVSSTDLSVRNDTGFALSVVETEESTKFGDIPKEDVKSGAEPKEQAVTNMDNVDPSVKNNSVFTIHGVEAEVLVKDGKNADKDTEAGGEPKQSMVEMQQAETDMVIADPSVENDMEFIPFVLGKEEFVDGRHADKDMKGSSEPTQMVVTSVSNADPSVQSDTEFVQSVVATEESTEFGDNPKKDMESDAERTRSIGETQQAVMNAKNVDPDVEDDPKCSPNVGQTEGVLKDENNADAVTQQDNADHADLDIGKEMRPAVSIVDKEETVVDKENTVTNPEAIKNLSKTDETTVHAQHGSCSLNSTEENAKEHAVIPLLSEADIPDMEHVEAASTSGVLSTLKEIYQAAGSTKSASRNHLSEDRSEECSEPQAPISHLKLEPTLGSCIGGVLLDNKSVKEDQHKNSGLKSEDISKEDLFHLKSTSQHDTPTTSEFSSMFNVSSKICDVEGMKKQPLENRQDPIHSRVNGKDIAGVQDASKTIVDQNEKEHAATNDPSQQHVNRGSFLPKPRLAVRSKNNDLVIMWDLPLDKMVTEIEYYELYSLNRSGQWWKIAKIKALQLPMGCTVKNIAPGKMSLFAVRAVARSGVKGPFSETSGIFYPQNGQ